MDEVLDSLCIQRDSLQKRMLRALGCEWPPPLWGLATPRKPDPVQPDDVAYIEENAWLGGVTMALDSMIYYARQPRIITQRGGDIKEFEALLQEYIQLRATIANHIRGEYSGMAMKNVIKESYAPSELVKGDALIEASGVLE